MIGWIDFFSKIEDFAVCLDTYVIFRFLLWCLDFLLILLIVLKVVFDFSDYFWRRVIEDLV